MKRQIVHLSMRWSHHSSHSGYDRISTNFSDIQVLQKLRIGPFWGIYWRLVRPVLRSVIGHHPYSMTNSLLELNAFRHLLLHRKSIYHYLYGEENFRLLRTSSSRLIATFHHPPSYLEQWGVHGDYLRNLHRVIILGESQRTYFERFVSPESIHFVPHGVDTEYFRPIEKPRPSGTFRCLTVGSWLRDHETLKATILSLQNEPYLKNAKFDIVGNDKLRKIYADSPNTQCHTGIPDSDLLSLYQNADLVLLPLTESVANNALLEAMACGRPVVVTDIGSSRNYADEDCVAFVPPGCSESLHKTVVALAGSNDHRAKLANTARSNALRFSWPRVAEQLREVYSTL